MINIVTNFVPVNPLDYSTSFQECIMILNSFVETGKQLRDEYLKFLYSHKQSRKLKVYKRRLQTLFDALISQQVLKYCPELKEYIYSVYDYSQGLMRNIDYVCGV